MVQTRGSRPFSLLIKPASADCNLCCAYCFYRSKGSLYPAVPVHRMSDATLERIVSSYLATEQPLHSFGWQGGEPTLMGVGFFRRVVELQRKHGKPGTVIGNAVQTNGILMDEEMARFLARARFLVGISIDGRADVHDRFRTDGAGAGSFGQVLRAIRILQSQGAALNALIAVHAANVDRPEDTYHSLVDQGILHHQYIPIVEFGSDGGAFAFSTTGRQWGEFLCRLFDAWLPDARRVSIRDFDAIISILAGGPAVPCAMAGDCRSYLLVEHNGDVYPCDFFAEPDLLLGNITQGGWGDFLDSPAYRDFGRRKAKRSPACSTCEYRALCAGDCPRRRAGYERSREQGSWLCEGWKMFYGHALGDLRRFARWLRGRGRERPASQASG